MLLNAGTSVQLIHITSLNVKRGGADATGNVCECVCVCVEREKQSERRREKREREKCGCMPLVKRQPFTRREPS